MVTQRFTHYVSHNRVGWKQTTPVLITVQVLLPVISSLLAHISNHACRRQSEFRPSGSNRGRKRQSSSREADLVVVAFKMKMSFHAVYTVYQKWLTRRL